MVTSPVRVEEDRALPRLQLSRGPLLPGTYAWLSTVLLPTLSMGGAVLPQALAWASGGALVGTCLPATARFARFRLVCLGAFLAGCLATWIILAEHLRIVPIDPVQAALGGIGWTLFAVSTQSQPIGVVPARTVPLPPEQLSARPFPVAMNGLFCGLVVVGLVPLFLAWRVERPAHGVLAQLVAGGAALAALSLTGSAVDTLGLRHRATPARARLAESWPTFALLVLLLVAGLFLKLF